MGWGDGCEENGMSDVIRDEGLKRICDGMRMG